MLYAVHVCRLGDHFAQSCSALQTYCMEPVLHPCTLCRNAQGEVLPQLVSPKLAKLMNSSEMVTWTQRRASFGTWTQPDPCAPPTGACSDGSGRCTGWLNQPCGTGGKGKCVLDTKDLGVKFGHDNTTGTCITDGQGRFPDLHGKNADGGDGATPFVERLWKAWAKNTTSI